MLGLPAILPPLLKVPVVPFFPVINKYRMKLESNNYNLFIEYMIESELIPIIRGTYIWYETIDRYKSSVYPIAKKDNEIDWRKGTVTEYVYIYCDKKTSDIIKGADPEKSYGDYDYDYVSVGINDGYVYIPLGISITCQYTGIPIFKNSIMIPGIGTDYGTTLAGAYEPYTGIDRKMAKNYPYENDLPDGQYYWLQNGLINPLKILKLNEMYTDPNYEPLLVQFYIYEKVKIECGFPKKCGEMTQEELNINGKCGLQEFLNTPISILPEDVAKRKKQRPEELTKDAKEEFKKWKQKRKEKMEENWNIAKQLKDNIFNRDITLQNFMSIANNMFPTMGFIDANCLKNTICEAQRKAQGEGNIKSLSDSLKNNEEATKLLLNDVANSIDKAATNAADTIGDFFKTAKDGLTNLASTFNLYQLCPRRFKDWLMDAGEAMGLPIGIDPFTQLQNIFSAGIINIFKDLLGECASISVGTQFINTAKNITNSQKQQLLTAFQSGNMNTFKDVVNGTSLKNDLINRTGMLDLTKMYNTPSFNMEKLNSLGDNLGRGLNSFNLLNNSSDTFNLIKNLNNANNNMERIYINL